MHSTLLPGTGTGEGTGTLVMVPYTESSRSPRSVPNRVVAALVTVFCAEESGHGVPPLFVGGAAYYGVIEGRACPPSPSVRPRLSKGEGRPSLGPLGSSSFRR